MLRWSMITGWIELLKNPRQLLSAFTHRRPSVGSQDFIMQSTPKHMSLTKQLGSEKQTPLSPATETRAVLGSRTVQPFRPSESVAETEEDKIEEEMERIDAEELAEARKEDRVMV